MNETFSAGLAEQPSAVAACSRSGGSLGRLPREHGRVWPEGPGRDRLALVGRPRPGTPNQALERTAAPPRRFGSGGWQDGLRAGGRGGRAAVAQLDRWTKLNTQQRP